MFRLFVISGLAALTLFSGAQMRGWSFMPSEAQEFQRQRAEEREARRSGSYGGGRSSGGFSGK